MNQARTTQTRDTTTLTQSETTCRDESDLKTVSFRKRPTAALGQDIRTKRWLESTDTHAHENGQKGPRLHTIVDADGKGPSLVVVETEAGPSSFLTRVLTLSVLHYSTFAGSILALALGWILLFLPQSWGIKMAVLFGLAVYASSYYDRAEYKGGRRSRKLLNSWSFWEHPMAWNEMEVIRTAKLDPQQKYVFAIYPHGIAALSRYFLTSPYFQLLFPDIKQPLQLATSLLFRIPLARELCLAMGYIDASRKSAAYALTRGENLSVYPGGVAEALAEGLTNDPRQLQIVRREGFVRLALEHDAHLVPVAVLGETRTYSCFPFPKAWVHGVYNVLKAPLQFAFGYAGSFIPKPVPITVVFGKPIALPRIPEPTKEQVKQYADIYFSEYSKLVQAYRHKLGNQTDVKLCMMDTSTAYEKV